MTAVKSFAIQRDDASWYAGRSEDGTAQWVEEFQAAALLEGYTEALELLAWLQQAGFNVKFFGLS